MGRPPPAVNAKLYRDREQICIWSGPLNPQIFLHFIFVPSSSENAFRKIDPNFVRISEVRGSKKIITST